MATGNDELLVKDAGSGEAAGNIKGELECVPVQNEHLALDIGRSSSVISMLFVSIILHFILWTLVQGIAVEDANPAIVTSAASVPYPHQTGLTEGCSRYHHVVEGDTCWAITNRYKISLVDFYKWNPAVGQGCETLWVGYYVCVAVSTSTSSSSTKTAKPTATAPSPTQSGTPPGCAEYYRAEPGDTCISIVTQKYPKISLAQFLDWNPGVGRSCQSMLAGYYYCVAAPTVEPEPTEMVMST